MPQNGGFAALGGTSIVVLGGRLKRSLGMAYVTSAMPKGSAFEPATLPDCKRRVMLVPKKR